MIVSKQKKLFLIGINRPEKRNSIDDETATQLRKAFEEFEKDNETYAAVLYGKGKYIIEYLFIYLNMYCRKSISGYSVLVSYFNL